MANSENERALYFRPVAKRRGTVTVQKKRRSMMRDKGTYLGKNSADLEGFRSHSLVHRGRGGKRLQGIVPELQERTGVTNWIRRQGESGSVARRLESAEERWSPTPKRCSKAIKTMILALQQAGPLVV